MNKRQLH